MTPPVESKLKRCRYKDFSNESTRNQWITLVADKKLKCSFGFLGRLMDVWVGQPLEVLDLPST